MLEGARILWIASRMELKCWPESLCCGYEQENKIMGTWRGVMISIPKHDCFWLCKNYDIELQPTGKPAN